MNEILSVIKHRRSVRQYENWQIADAQRDAILDAALYAPTAMNQQKWHFSVVQNPDVIKQMVQITKENKLNSNIPILMKKAQSSDYHTYYGAPTVIVVSGEKQAKFIQLDCAAAAQNIALAAASLGLGSCIMTSAGFLFASDKGLAMKQELGIPDDYDHICSIALGHISGGTPAPPPRNTTVFTYIP
jgi:nitroreductase